MSTTTTVSRKRPIVSSWLEDDWGRSSNQKRRKRGDELVSLPRRPTFEDHGDDDSMATPRRSFACSFAKRLDEMKQQQQQKMVPPPPATASRRRRAPSAVRISGGSSSIASTALTAPSFQHKCGSTRKNQRTVITAGGEASSVASGSASLAALFAPPKIPPPPRIVPAVTVIAARQGTDYRTKRKTPKVVAPRGDEESSFAGESSSLATLFQRPPRNSVPIKVPVTTVAMRSPPSVRRSKSVATKRSRRTGGSSVAASSCASLSALFATPRRRTTPQHVVPKAVVATRSSPRRGSIAGSMTRSRRSTVRRRSRPSGGSSVVSAGGSLAALFTTPPPRNKTQRTTQSYAKPSFVRPPAVRSVTAADRRGAQHLDPRCVSSRVQPKGRTASRGIRNCVDDILDDDSEEDKYYDLSRAPPTGSVPPRRQQRAADSKQRSARLRRNDLVNSASEDSDDGVLVIGDDDESSSDEGSERLVPPKRLTRASVPLTRQQKRKNDGMSQERSPLRYPARPDEVGPSQQKQHERSLLSQRVLQYSSRVASQVGVRATSQTRSNIGTTLKTTRTSVSSSTKPDAVGVRKTMAKRLMPGHSSMSKPINFVPTAMSTRINSGGEILRVPYRRPSSKKVAPKAARSTITPKRSPSVSDALFTPTITSKAIAKGTPTKILRKAVSPSPPTKIRSAMRRNHSSNQSTTASLFEMFAGDSQSARSVVLSRKKAKPRKGKPQLLAFRSHPSGDVIQGATLAHCMQLMPSSNPDQCRILQNVRERLRRAKLDADYYERSVTTTTCSPAAQKEALREARTERKRLECKLAEIRATMQKQQEVTQPTYHPALRRLPTVSIQPCATTAWTPVPIGDLLEEIRKSSSSDEESSDEEL